MADALAQYNAILEKTVGRFGGNVMPPLKKADPKEDPLKTEDQKQETSKKDTAKGKPEEEQLDTALQETEREANVAYATINKNSKLIQKLALSLGSTMPNAPKYERAFWVAVTPLQNELKAMERVKNLYAGRNPTVVYPLVVLRGFTDTLRAILLGLKAGMSRNKNGQEPSRGEELQNPLAVRTLSLLDRITKRLRKGSPEAQGQPAPGSPAQDVPEETDPRALRNKQEAHRYKLYQRDATKLMQLVRANFNLALGFAGEDLLDEASNPPTILERINDTAPQIEKSLKKLMASLNTAARSLGALQKKDPIPATFAMLCFTMAQTFTSSALRVKLAIQPMHQLAQDAQAGLQHPQQQPQQQQENQTKPFSMGDEKSNEDEVFSLGSEDEVKEDEPMTLGDEDMVPDEEDTEEELEDADVKKPTQEDVLADKVKQLERLRRERNARMRVAHLKKGWAA